MSDRNDGGPVFPGERAEMLPYKTHGGMCFNAVAPVKYPGMSLRDYFAGQFATIAAQEGMRGYSHICSETARRTAEYAYALADAMLATRTGDRDV